jgi:hypothetical protein
MKSEREAKKILKAYGKAEFRARVNYVDSFIPGKTSFAGAISYRHAFKRLGMITALMILVMALAVSVYAASMHILNYTKIVHDTNDEYRSNIETVDKVKDIEFFEPTYIPDRFVLDKAEYDELFQEKTWIYTGPDNETLIIMQHSDDVNIHIDNERSESEAFTVDNLEGVLYDFRDEIACVIQYESTVITITGTIDREELINVIRGMNIPE